MTAAATAAIVAASSIGCHTTIASQSRSLPDILPVGLHVGSSVCCRIASGASGALCMG